MSIRILFFGATADITGKRVLEDQISEEIPVSVFLENMKRRFPGLASHRLHISIDQEYGSADDIIGDGDEVAIFTAVSGG
jgi:molybdopterin converting factor small subunit